MSYQPTSDPRSRRSRKRQSATPKAHVTGLRECRHCTRHLRPNSRDGVCSACRREHTCYRCGLVSPTELFARRCKYCFAWEYDTWHWRARHSDTLCPADLLEERLSLYASQVALGLPLSPLRPELLLPSPPV